MKRDMDLVRDILILVSESNHPVDAGAFVTKENDLQKVVYTIEIMNAAGLVKADMQKAMGGIYVNATIKSLTWTGNDYLDAIREGQVWKKVKRTIAKTAVSAPFAEEVGDLLAKTFQEEIGKEQLPDGRMYYNIVDRHQEHFDKYVRGTKHYEAYRLSRQRKGWGAQGRLTVSFNKAQQLLNDYSGKGIVVSTNDGKPKKQEDVNFQKVIGYYVKNGEEYPTTKGRIHYGKKGAHIVPVEGGYFD